MLILCYLLLNEISKTKHPFENIVSPLAEKTCNIFFQKCFFSVQYFAFLKSLSWYRWLKSWFDPRKFRVCVCHAFSMLLVYCFEFRVVVHVQRNWYSWSYFHKYIVDTTTKNEQLFRKWSRKHSGRYCWKLLVQGFGNFTLQKLKEPVHGPCQNNAMVFYLLLCFLW